MDDDKNLSRLAGMILENSGKYEVMIVNESARALPSALQFRADLMLLDVDMSGKCGGDLARDAALDSRLRDIPVLFLTGLVSHAEAGTAPMESGGMKIFGQASGPGPAPGHGRAAYSTSHCLRWSALGGNALYERSDVERSAHPDGG